MCTYEFSSRMALSLFKTVNKSYLALTTLSWGLITYVMTMPSNRGVGCTLKLKPRPCCYKLYVDKVVCVIKMSKHMATAF